MTSPLHPILSKGRPLRNADTGTGYAQQADGTHPTGYCPIMWIGFLGKFTAIIKRNTHPVDLSPFDSRILFGKIINVIVLVKIYRQQWFVISHNLNLVTSVVTREISWYLDFRQMRYQLERWHNISETSPDKARDLCFLCLIEYLHNWSNSFI